MVFIGWLTVYVDPTAIGTAKDTAHIFEDMNPEGTYNVTMTFSKTMAAMVNEALVALVQEAKAARQAPQAEA